MKTWMIQAGLWLGISAVTLYQYPGDPHVHWFITYAVVWTLAGYLKGDSR